MLTHIPNVLTPAQVKTCRTRLDRAEWRDGRLTAGYQSAKVKHNQQAPNNPEIAELEDMVVSALEANPLFHAAALPRVVVPPLFNRYEAGMYFGTHVDNAVRPVPGRQHRVRTDISATLFLSEPGDYDGGELVIEDTYGSHRVKLPAGDMVIYPGGSLHHVTPVTRGVRVAAFFWVQSLVRDDGARSLLYELDTAIQELTALDPDAPALVRLTGCYHNLLRRWVEI